MSEKLDFDMNDRIENRDRIKRRKEANRKRKQAYRQRVVIIQIAVISIVFIVSVLSAAAFLTSLMSKNNSEDANAQNDQMKDEYVDNQGNESNEGDEGIKNEVTEIPTPTPTPESIAPVESVSITISMAGDCTIGTDINFSKKTNFTAYYNKYKDYGYFFKNVKDIFEADDLTIVNMEGTLTDSNGRRDKKFAFKGDPAYTQILTLGGVEAANLANNHSYDYGEQGYQDTIHHLENAGVRTFGHDRTVVMDVKGIKVGLVGIYELAKGIGCKEQMLENIKKVEAEGAQIVIVSFHWGTEKDYYPDKIQKELAHSAIDNGADLVVGHHPHVLQGIEEYKGKSIVYSLGNFCFGGNSNPSDKNTMIFQQTFTIRNGVLVEDNKINVIPCCVSSTWKYNDYCPTPVEGEKEEEILNLIQKYSEGL